VSTQPSVKWSTRSSDLKCKLPAATFQLNVHSYKEELWATHRSSTPFFVLLKLRSDIHARFSAAWRKRPSWRVFPPCCFVCCCNCNYWPVLYPKRSQEELFRSTSGLRYRPIHLNLVFVNERSYYAATEGLTLEILNNKTNVMQLLPD